VVALAKFSPFESAKIYSVKHGISYAIGLLEAASERNARAHH